ncbi:GlxA family transcriptional regulator [Thalassotalea fonticola]|uniref:GlxA family transcriptional regulator n=1 Tax=Thalassotalea fonticola TaxID=3065649 RepID=A0ABZ0GPX8_9GAMM|nr:GlxA family transcriptional regulator [Colwelliaceae bacterium S1-1]
MPLAKSNSSKPPVKCSHVGFLLQPNFTMLALSSAIEPMRMANQLSGQTLYRWTILSEDGRSVTASDGLKIEIDSCINNHVDFDTVLVCGGVDIKSTITRKTLSWLTHLSRCNIVLGGICTGSYLLAKAGLLDGYQCTIHWELLASWQEEFPFLKSSNQLFTYDRDRITCSGGTAPMDMMLHVIAKEYGKELTTAISDMFTHENIRDENDQQRIPLQHIVGATQSKLQDVVGLMEANIEEVLCLDELANYVDLSRRQLERLFQKYLDCSPHRYYLQLRLTRARQLLKQTSMSIIEIAIACGFVSTPHFSKCYRNSFNIPPRDERNVISANMQSAASNESSLGSVTINHH